MRQAIKGDGTDGTAALKAYLLEHDEVLSQELYEFIRPGIGAIVNAMDVLASVVLQKSSLVNDFGGLGLFPGDVTMPNATVAGNILFAFMYNADSGGVTPGISDSGITDIAGWTQIFHLDIGGARFTVWSATAVTAAPGGTVSFSTGSNRSNSEFFVVEVPAIYAGFVYGNGSGSGTTASVTVGGETLTANTASGLTWYMFAILLNPGAGPPVMLGFANHPTLGWDDSIIGGGASDVIVGQSPSVSIGSPALVLGRFTDASSPLTYAGNVYAPAVMKNDGFKSKIGLDVDSLQLSWTFRGDEAMVADPDTGATILTMLQGFQQGLWAGIWVKWWRPYMPTFGDCDSLGAVRMFRGRIGPVVVDRLTARITINSVTEMFNRQIPQQLIEANNRSGQVGPGLPPDLSVDPTHLTYFQCVSGHGGTVQKIVAEQTLPTAGLVYAPGTFDLGYLLFQSSPLHFFVAQIQHSEVIDGFNVFYLFKPLYVDPHSYPLTFIAFVPIPKDQDVSGGSGVELKGFKYVPLPEQAV